MNFRRQEGFRYTFNDPIPCLFKIIRIDDKPINSPYGEGHIIDISPSGIKLMSLLDLSSHNKQVEIEIKFTISGVSFEVPGFILWKRKDYKNNYSYGVKLVIFSEIEEQIIETIKLHARNAINKKKAIQN